MSPSTFQDLKQQKFVIDAEPSETVSSLSSFRQDLFSAGLSDMIGRASEGEDFPGEGLGSFSTEADLLWYVDNSSYSRPRLIRNAGRYGACAKVPLRASPR